MIQSASAIPTPAAESSTTGSQPVPRRLWGLSPTELHDRRWASLAVEVVRPGQERTVTARGPALYLLLDRDVMALFELAPVTRRMAWLKPALMRIRLRGRGGARYFERVESNPDGTFQAVTRRYGRRSAGATRAVLTPSARLAQQWADASDARHAWRDVRDGLPDERVAVWRCPASVYDAADAHDVDECIEELQTDWRSPDAALDGVYEFQPGVWLHETVVTHAGVRFVAPAWVGAGAHVPPDSLVLGPCSIPDDPRARVSPSEPAWEDIERDGRLLRPRHVHTRRRRVGKRLFDIVFSLAVLLGTLPIYPLVMLVILLEDGWPVFFAHQRQTLRGRNFPCLKFRTMRKDAEHMKEQLAKENQADGPQFFIENDPRLLRCGKFLRKTQIDELPQFINVLLGHMSVVGPRPSPDKENQFCPAWREARLSVRPGVTGLWQVRRTREPETDFQEWIRYDLEYVRRQSYRLDVWIIVQTVLRMVKG